ncbi:MAG: hypothetical protein JWQ93_2503 [Marmoricola sp.]|jgi:hypothetical protein|nr:hypothetical protein [Marmoricola sp.]MCW2836048.1 hypothetical protein [Marmoricola sp.]
MTTRNVCWLALALVTMMLGVTGCSHAAASEHAPASRPAAKVEAGDGSHPARITLSEEAVRRLGIETQPVRTANGSGAGAALVPYSAVVYDAEGSAWAFTSPSQRTYVRAPLKILAIENDRVTLTSGPPPGTELVTVGAAELVGAEAGINGEE